MHARVVATRLGSGDSEVYLFEPADPSPVSAPVVVFLHGWVAMDPNYYGAWVTHIVRRGFTVVFPRYQADVRTHVANFTPNALAATQRALEKLRQPGHVAPDPRGLAFVGHSMGGLVAANLAVRAVHGELPPPLALMSVQPGKTWPEGTRIAFPLDDVAALPSNLLLVTMVGDDDDFVGDIDAKKIFDGATSVPVQNKNYVLLRSDDHGSPAFVADHRAATAPATLVTDEASAAPPRAPGSGMGGLLAGRGPIVTDALDYYGTWKIFDGLADTSFAAATGNTPSATRPSSAIWADGATARRFGR